MRIGLWLIVLALSGCKEEEKDCWYCAGKSDNADKDGDKDYGKEGEKEGAYVSLNGEFDLGTEEGTLSIEGEDCLSLLPFEGATAVSGCTNCDPALTLTVGAPQSGADRCDDDALYAGPWDLGHRADVLMTVKEGDWYEAGVSSVTGDLWEFTFGK